MTTNFSLYREAVLDDGCSVLKQVVTVLYQGGNMRPDFYFQDIGQQQKYNHIFPNDQRRVIESSGASYCYDIKIGVEYFDVSILSYLVEHTCGLPSSDILVKTVSKVRKLRNNVAHSQGEVSLTKSELCEKLDQLLEWYITILERTESHGGCYLFSEKTQIRRKIQQKKSRAQDSWTAHSSRRSDFDCNPYLAYSASTSKISTSATKSDSGIPTWGKVALGVTAGIAALGIVGAAATMDDEEQSKCKQKKRDQKDEECAVM